MTTIYTFTEDLLKATVSEMWIQPFAASSPRSAFNGQNFTTGPVTEYWKLRLTITPTTEDEWRALRALTFRLRGGKNLLRVYDPSSIALRGAGGPMPTINVQANGAAGDETITLKNLTPSQAVGLADGDYIGVGENAHMVMGDAPTDSSGYCSPNILPALRQGVAIDDPVTTTKVTSLFIATAVPTIPVGLGLIGQSFQMDLMEDPDIG